MVVCGVIGTHKTRANSLLPCLDSDSTHTSVMKIELRSQRLCLFVYCTIIVAHLVHFYLYPSLLRAYFASSLA